MGKVKNEHGKKAKIHLNLFGQHAVRAAWHNPDRDIRTLYLTKDAMRQFEPHLSVKGVKRPPPTIIDKRDLDHATNGAVHQGIALDTASLEEMFLQDLIIRAENNEKSCLIMLDQVTDPHNVGAILRSAAAFGAGGVIMQRKGAPEIGGTLAKTACGAVEHVPVIYETNLSRTLETLQASGWFAIGMDERGQSLHDAPVYDKTVLVLGAEGPGLRPNVAKHCDLLARLPMNTAMPSINVSNAAAVALYEILV